MGRKSSLLFLHSAFDSAENLHAIKVSTLCCLPSVLHILYLSCWYGRADVFGKLSFLYTSSITALKIVMDERKKQNKTTINLTHGRKFAFYPMSEWKRIQIFPPAK